jgi:hypothetical protein
MTIYRFQISAETEKEAQKFMNAVAAAEVVIEDWSGVHKVPTLKEVYGFGQAYSSPEQLLQIASTIGIDLVYLDEQDKIDREIDQLVLQTLQAYHKD